MCPRSLYNREDCGVGGCLSRAGNYLGPELAEIKSEQALVETNRELVERFEKKIHDTLDRVWGDAEPDTGEAWAMEEAAELSDYLPLFFQSLKHHIRL